MNNSGFYPNDPSAAGRITMDGIYSNLPQGLQTFNPNVNSSMSGGVTRGNTQYNDGFNVHQHPRDLSIPTKMSDELPYERNMEDYKNIVRRKRNVVSSLHRAPGGSTSDFYVNLQEYWKDIRYVRFLKCTINYTAGATPFINGFVYFPDLTNTEAVSNNEKYHVFFPIIQGSAGTDVVFSYVFSDDYLTEIKKLDTIKNKLRVQIYKEDPSSGNLVFFTEINSFAIEMEIGYIDQGYKLEQEIRR